MLVAPTELKHPAFRSLTHDGRGSNLPELHGCDFMFIARKQRFGVQRKELKDFVASINDRLKREIPMMTDGRLAMAVLVLEGTPKWTLDGELVLPDFGHGTWSQDKHQAYLLSVQQAGVMLACTPDVPGTVRFLRAFERWAKKEKHSAFSGRPGPTGGSWGQKGHRQFQQHILEGFPGIGSETSGQILDEVGMPLMWKPGMPEGLKELKGIGPKTVEKLREAL